MGGGAPRPPHTDYGENKRAPNFGVSTSKIATKAIAIRIKDRITKIVDVSQTGFIKRRYIGEHIRLISDII